MGDKHFPEAGCVYQLCTLRSSGYRGERDLLIPKKLWLTQEDRYLTFREIIQSDIGQFSRTEEYSQRGIQVIENTPEEIYAVAVEMDERLKGTWQTSLKDEELQQRFWSLYTRFPSGGPSRCRIGAEFLRQNPRLLV